MARTVEQDFDLFATDGMSAPGQFVRTGASLPAGQTVTRIVGRVSAGNFAGLLSPLFTPVRVAVYIRGVSFPDLFQGTLTAEAQRVKWATMLYPTVTNASDQAGSQGDFPQPGVDHAEFDVRGQFRLPATENVRIHFHVATTPLPAPSWRVAGYVRIFSLNP